VPKWKTKRHKDHKKETLRKSYETKKNATPPEAEVGPISVENPLIKNSFN
jgi:hypothetical protein